MRINAEICQFIANNDSITYQEVVLLFFTAAVSSNVTHKAICYLLCFAHAEADVEVQSA